MFIKKQSILADAARFSQDIEQDVNVWLAAHPTIKVVDIKQSSSGGSFEASAIAISIWYEADD